MESIRWFEVPKIALEQHKFDARILARTIHENKLAWPTKVMYSTSSASYAWQGVRNTIGLDCLGENKFLTLAYIPAISSQTPGVFLGSKFTEQQRIKLPDQGWSDALVPYLKGIRVLQPLYLRTEHILPIEDEKLLNLKTLRKMINKQAALDRAHGSSFATVVENASLPGQHKQPSPSTIAPLNNIYTGRSVQEDARIAVNIINGLLPEPPPPPPPPSVITREAEIAARIM